MLSIRDEKISERVFFEALDEARSLWPGDVTVRDYTVTASTLTSPPHPALPHFILFLELDGPPLAKEQTELVGLYDLCAFLEKLRRF